METEGIPCIHLIAFFNYSGLTSLPLQYICKRWLKSTKNGIKVHIYDDSSKKDRSSIFIYLSRRANELVNEALVLDHLQSILKKYFEAAKEEMASASDSMKLVRKVEAMMVLFLKVDVQ